MEAKIFKKFWARPARFCVINLFKRKVAGVAHVASSPGAKIPPGFSVQESHLLDVDVNEALLHDTGLEPLLYFSLTVGGIITFCYSLRLSSHHENVRYL